MTRVIILCNNYEKSNFPREPDDKDRFFTYGYGSSFGKLIKTHLLDYEVEVWRNDSHCIDKYYSKTANGIKYRVFRSTPIYKLGQYSRHFTSEIKKENKINSPIFLIVHTNSWQTYQILFSLKDAKIVTTHHGEWSPFYLYHSTSGLRKIKALLGMFAEKAVLKKVNHFLIGDTRQVEYIKKAVKDFRYTLFSSGLDFDTFLPVSRQKAREMLGWKKDTNYILYVGKLYKYKQVDELIKIWREIKDEIPDTELVLVGNEPRGYWGEEYYDMALESGAMIIGRVLHSELYKYYCASNVFVLIALRDDFFGGTGIAPIESLALNTPVVSYSMRNYLGNENERKFEMPSDLKGYKSAIIKILKNKEINLNLRDTVKKYYSHEAIVKLIEKAFNEVLNTN